MFALLVALIAAAGSALRSRANLAVENLALRRQLAVFRRRRPRPSRAWTDRIFWVALSRTWALAQRLVIVARLPSCAGTALLSGVSGLALRRAPGRPPSIAAPGRVRQMAQANPLWGAPRIHGELLKLGIGLSEREVSRLIARGSRKSPSQTWCTFLTDHIGTLSSIDFFTVPTATFASSTSSLCRRTPADVSCIST